MSAIILTLSPRILPSLLTASSRYCLCPLPCQDESMLSLLDSTHFTGLFILIEA